MTSIRSFFDKLPVALCRQFVERHSSELAANIHWDAPDLKTWRRESRESIEGAPGALRHRIEQDVERISELADEAGEAAIRAVSQYPNQLEGLPSNAARSLSMFLNDNASFHRAEEIRYTDERRKGRFWSGFQGKSGRSIEIDPTTKEHLKRLVRERSPSQKVHIDVYERTRVASEDQSYRLLQVTIYSEGWPDVVKEFEGEELQGRTRRPVYEAAITYEPESGALEVVGKDRKAREQLALLFSKAVLGVDSQGESLPLRRYDLSCLRRPHEFPRDAADRIANVRVCMLRLTPNDTLQQQLVLETGAKSEETIWDMAEHRLGSGNPFHGPWQISQAKLSITFHRHVSPTARAEVAHAITLRRGTE